mmetsp:Transcript_4887/g.16943  ORF Transcript_4887/g.16943 Transcript_4887/m.16943 type:complete len:311 (+) Transcript_4887:941-1873(+)
MFLKALLPQRVVEQEGEEGLAAKLADSCVLSAYEVLADAVHKVVNLGQHHAASEQRSQKCKRGLLPTRNLLEPQEAELNQHPQLAVLRAKFWSTAEEHGEELESVRRMTSPGPKRPIRVAEHLGDVACERSCVRFESREPEREHHPEAFEADGDGFRVAAFQHAQQKRHHPAKHSRSLFVPAVPHGRRLFLVVGILLLNWRGDTRLLPLEERAQKLERKVHEEMVVWRGRFRLVVGVRHWLVVVVDFGCDQRGRPFALRLRLWLGEATLACRQHCTSNAFGFKSFTCSLLRLQAVVHSAEDVPQKFGRGD